MPCPWPILLPLVCSYAEVTYAPDTVLEDARLQASLARAGFSPGLIDGKAGRKTRLATEQFQRTAGLAPTGKVDPATRAALVKYMPAEWTREYRITRQDADLITGPVPSDWNERAALSLSGYESLHELLAERGWCSLGMVTLLNPGTELGAVAVGDVVRLPDMPDPRDPKHALPTPEYLVIDLDEKLVRGLSDSGIELFLFHCSVAQHAEKRPKGELRVKVVVTDPDYTFNPEQWPEVEGVTRKLRIAPGPRNPVGSAWIGLDKPGYGIHGSPRPQDIGKTGSHGCFRLTNWDALRLVHAVRPGMRVVVSGSGSDE